jgi:hypothetical protein
MVEVELVSSAHGTMALSHVASVLYGERRDPDDLVVCPDPEEWLGLWENAVEATREAALGDLRERALTALDLHRSIDDVRGDHERPPTAGERALVETLAMAHYEAWGRVSRKEMAPWVTRDPGRLASDRAAMAELLRIGAVQPGPAFESVMSLDAPERLRELGVEEVARGAIEALVEALDREGCKLAEPDVMQRAVAAAMRDVVDGEEKISAEGRAAIERFFWKGWPHRRGSGADDTGERRRADDDVARRRGDREVVDGERATQEINAAAPAGPDLSLYVVCTNPPGPGAATLIGEEIDKVRARVRNGEIDSDVGDELVAAALRGAQRACEFVELEDADGASRGDSVGARWEEHGEAWRLGPFSRAAVLEEAPR